jgi:putative transposase
MSVHVIHRGHNCCAIFRDDPDRRFFLSLFQIAGRRYDVAVHAFVLMTTHVHLIVTPGDKWALPRTMKLVGQRYVRYFNRKYERVGTLWCGRYRGLLITDACYWLTCLRYVEQNPVRAGLVTAPDAYGWSSHRMHAFGEPTSWLVQHATYLGLGKTDGERQAAYRAISAESLNDTELAFQRYPPPTDIVSEAH